MNYNKQTDDEVPTFTLRQKAGRWVRVRGQIQGEAEYQRKPGRGSGRISWSGRKLLDHFACRITKKWTWDVIIRMMRRVAAGVTDEEDVYRCG